MSGHKDAFYPGLVKLPALFLLHNRDQGTIGPWTSVKHFPYLDISLLKFITQSCVSIPNVYGSLPFFKTHIADASHAIKKRHKMFI